MTEKELRVLAYRATAPVADRLRLVIEEADELYYAVLFAAEKHEGQTDKQGQPYILHPLEVMKSAQTLDEAIVAVLHDVLEDTDATEQDLRDLGLPMNVIEAVVALTRREGEVYIRDFIHRIAKNPLASQVKIYDLNHNLSRIAGLPPEEQSISQRYERALKILTKEKRT